MKQNTTPVAVGAEQLSPMSSPVEALAKIACSLAKERYPEATGASIAATAGTWLKAAGLDLLGAVVEQGRRS